MLNREKQINKYVNNNSKLEYAFPAENARRAVVHSEFENMFLVKPHS